MSEVDFFLLILSYKNVFFLSRIVKEGFGYAIYLIYENVD